MGEIMQWRVARSAQRRVPEPGSLVKLDAEEWKLDTATQDKLKSLQQTADTTNPAFAAYANDLSDLPTLRQYLATASPVVSALFSLDEWLASQNNLPSAKAFMEEVAATVGPYLTKPEWQQLRKVLAEIFYAALVISALNVPGVPAIILVDVLGLLARLLLVVALVDSSVGNTPTQDDIYNALRWRTVVLPDWLTLLLLAIRIAKKAVIVRKPGFADLYVTREEWDHYEPVEIASIENIMAHELKSRVHVLVNQTQVTTTTDQTTASLKNRTQQRRISASCNSNPRRIFRLRHI